MYPEGDARVLVDEAVCCRAFVVRDALKTWTRIHPPLALRYHIINHQTDKMSMNSTCIYTD